MHGRSTTIICQRKVQRRLLGLSPGGGLPCQQLGQFRLLRDDSCFEAGNLGVLGVNQTLLHLHHPLLL